MKSRYRPAFNARVYGPAEHRADIYWQKRLKRGGERKITKAAGGGWGDAGVSVCAGQERADEFGENVFDQCAQGQGKPPVGRYKTEITVEVKRMDRI
jgi:hypothetical protein